VKVCIVYRPEWTAHGYVLWRQVGEEEPRTVCRAGTTRYAAHYKTVSEALGALAENAKADRAAGTRLGVEVEAVDVGMR
jgi:hypothetical protein